MPGFCLLLWGPSISSPHGQFLESATAFCVECLLFFHPAWVRVQKAQNITTADRTKTCIRSG